MTENQFGPRDDEASERTRVSYPQQPASQGQPPTPGAPPAPGQPQPAYPGAAPSQQPPFQQSPPAGYQSYGQAQQGMPSFAAAQPQAGYFRSLFDLSYENLGAPKFARVFQLLFMIVSGLAVVITIVNFAGHGSFLPLIFGVVVLPLVWLLLNTLVRLILEAVVGIVQTAENSEQMLQILRDRGSA